MAQIRGVALTALIVLIISLCLPRSLLAQEEETQLTPAVDESGAAEPTDEATDLPADAPADALNAPADAAQGLSEEELKELEGEIDQAVGVGPEVFDEGVEDYYKGNYEAAASKLYEYLAGNQQGADKYGYAEFFIASCFDKLNLTHAAMEYYYNVAKNRTRPELLPDALEAIERITRKVPFDEELILLDLLHDTTFGYLRADLLEFVEYYQGLLDYRNGFIRWATIHFSKLKKGSYYYYKSRYVQAVYELVRHNLDKSLEIFVEILNSQVTQTDVINNSRQSVARILFEQKKFKEAYQTYESITAPIEKQASVFLEEAWTKYYLKDYKRAMGLLYALEAPCFYRYFTPEKHILKSLIYKNLCHYNVAKDAVSEFFQQYGDALRGIYDRIDLEKNDILLDAALQEPILIDLGRFQRLLDTEIGELSSFGSGWSSTGLTEHLMRIYEIKIKSVNRTIKERLEDSIRNVAEKLLEHEEQMNLLEYEIGLSMYKRIKGAPNQKDTERERIPYAAANVYYEFDGEFWNDELHDFRFFIEDRCFSEERWE